MCQQNGLCTTTVKDPLSEVLSVLLGMLEAVQVYWPASVSTMERKRSSDRVNAPPSGGTVTVRVIINVGSLSLRELRSLGPVHKKSGAGRPKASQTNTTSSVSFTVEFIGLDSSSTGAVEQVIETRQTHSQLQTTFVGIYNTHAHTTITAQGLHLPLTVRKAMAEVLLCTDTSSLLAMHEYPAVSEN